jgi:cell wall assembly regulator SMI1
LSSGPIRLGSNWNVAMYIQQWRNISDQVVQSSWYKAAKHPPKFQAAVFADPPWVPDQQDEVDDFDIINLTRAGLTEHDKIGSYAVHLYPQSTGDAARWYRLSLNLLSDQSVLWHNVSQYVPQVAAADKAGIPLVFGETIQPHAQVAVASAIHLALLSGISKPGNEGSQLRL